MVDNLARHLVDLGNSLDMVDTQDTHLVVASLDTALAMDMDIHKWMAWYTHLDKWMAWYTHLVVAQDNLASLDLGSSLDLVARPMVVALMTTLVVMLVVSVTACSLYNFILSKWQVMVSSPVTQVARGIGDVMAVEGGGM